MITDNHDERQPLNQNPTSSQPAPKKGKEYWRSLKEYASSPDFEARIRQEYPRQAALLSELSRRDFLKLLGGSLALAGLTSCAPQPPGKILPYTNAPEQLVPAKSVYFASAMVQDGFAKGVLIETTMGRPIKVEGNPSHPQSLGASDVFMQASILDMYDPDRAKQVLNQGAQKTWQDFVTAVASILSGVGQGAGLRILTGPITSPTFTGQMKALLEKYPQARWVQYSPVGRSNTLAGMNMAFGQPLEAVYDFNKADVILSLDSDFLFEDPGHVRYGHDFGIRHQPISPSGTMNRLYVVESAATVTGANADHRLPVKPSQVEAFARAIASRLGVGVSAPSGEVPGQDWLDPLADDLRKAGPAALVIAGERQPAAVHAIAHAINQALGSIGNTVTLIASPQSNPLDPNAELKSLADELNGGQIETLVIMGINAAYAAPVDLNFAEAVKKARTVIYHGLYVDETAELATWFIPAAHFMEMWGDALAVDGSASVIQPVIEPLYGGKSQYELLAALQGQGDANGFDIVRSTWQGQLGSSDFEASWRAILSKGIITGAAVPEAPTISQVNAGAIPAAGAAPSGGLEIVFQPDYGVWDGQFANNAWLQELPKNLTKLTWDNAAFVSPATASRLGVADDDLVTLKLRDHSVDAPIFIEPGQPDDVVRVTLGYGRKSGGNVLVGAGFNAYAIRTSGAPWFDTGLEVTRTGGTYPLASTRDHWSMENRDIIRSASMDEYQANPKFAQHEEENPPTLYSGDEYLYQSPDYAWGMSINLNSCIGCNACVVACQAENNIPTVGKKEVQNHREMHWLRIDRYYRGTPDKAQVIAFQPVPCMHCEKAPCEVVCPVEATSHSAEGLNEMTYNRCVGTRYCSNNCPYKVRRFNFYKYTNFEDESLKAMRNPDVTVRMRGVMEKCTYCVQRINESRIQAEIEGRQIKDGEVKTACQQACPTGAIVFGNIKDANSAVSQEKATPLNYGLLAELGTRPRTTYLAKVKNPNPLIKEQA